jgi:hypothetical protein
VPFDRSHIVDAVQGATREVGLSDPAQAERVTDAVLAELAAQAGAEPPPESCWERYLLRDDRGVVRETPGEMMDRCSAIPTPPSRRTVNLPAQASVEEVKRLYVDASPSTGTGARRAAPPGARQRLAAGACECHLRRRLRGVRVRVLTPDAQVRCGFSISSSGRGRRPRTNQPFPETYRQSRNGFPS